VSEKRAVRVTFVTAAESELRDIALRYEQESASLSEHFESEVRRGVDFIAANPEAAPRIRNEVRRKVLRRFPFSVFYAIEPDRIRILAVAHHHRRPGYWSVRLRG
jgi:plasmid stabilization system protein ParE